MAEQNERSKRKTSPRPSFVWPLILVTLGVVFLLSNLGILQGDLWNDFWRLWPVIFIAIGLDSLFRRYEIAGPVFMVVLGSVLLMNSLGILGWGTWELLWRLWPILLVTVGIEIIIGRRNLWISTGVVIVIVGLLGGVIWYVDPPQLAYRDELEEASVHQALDDIEQARLTFKPAVGRLDLSRSQDTGILVSGSYQTQNDGQVYAGYEVDGRTGIFEMKTQPVMMIPNDNGWEWELDLTDQIPLDLEMSMGVGELVADLSELDLSALDVNQAVGEVVVTLAAEESYSGEFSQAIGKIQVEIPESAGVRIKVSRAISSLSIPSDFDQYGDFYYSPNYEDAEIKIQLEISQAIGSIEVGVQH